MKGSHYIRARFPTTKLGRFQVELRILFTIESGSCWSTHIVVHRLLISIEHYGTPQLTIQKTPFRPKPNKIQINKTFYQNKYSGSHLPLLTNWAFKKVVYVHTCVLFHPFYRIVSCHFLHFQWDTPQGSSAAVVTEARKHGVISLLPFRFIHAWLDENVYRHQVAKRDCV